MTPRTHGLVQAVAESALTDAADLRREAEALRAEASDKERLAAVLESLHRIAEPHARLVREEAA